MDKRRLSGLILLAASVIVLFLVVKISYGSDRLDDLVVSAQEIEAIVESRQDCSFDQLIIKLEGNEIFKEASSDRFFYSMIEDGKNALNPTVKVLGRDKGLKLLVNEKHLTRESIENNQALEMVVYNDTYFHKYYLVTTSLPIMNLDCKNEISEEDGKMNMTLWDNRSNASSRVIVSDGLVRFRGASTLHYPKKSMKLTLTTRSLGNNKRNNDVSLLGLRRDDDWILYAAYNDQEKVRNVFSHNLWDISCAEDNSKNVHAGMQYKYLELFVDGQYYGLYALGSPLDELQFQLSGDVSKDALYKSIYWSTIDEIMMPENAVTSFECKSLSELAKVGKSAELEKVLIDGYDTPFIDNSAWDLFLDYSYYLERYRKDSQALLKGIDLDNAIDLYLFFGLIQGADTTMGNLTKNYYFSLSKENDLIKALYAPWDMDISWGNLWTGDIDVNFTLPYQALPEDNYLFEAGYFNQIMVNNDGIINDRFFEKYRNLRQGDWSEESITAMLDEYEADIYLSGAYRREMSRWPDGTYNDPDEKLSNFKDYVRVRLTEYDAFIERLAKNFDKSVLVRRISQIKGIEESNVFIAINDASALYDKDYLDLIEYLGADPSVLNESTTMIVRNGRENKVEYLDYPIENSASYDSVIGEISLAQTEGLTYYTENDFGVFVDGKHLYDTLSVYEPAVRVYVINENGCKTIDMIKDYSLNLWLNTLNDINLYLKALNQYNYNVTIEYEKSDFTEDKQIAEELKALDDRLTMIENPVVKGIRIVVTDRVTQGLMDKAYYEYVMDNTNGIMKCRIKNCIRHDD